MNIDKKDISEKLKTKEKYLKYFFQMQKSGTFKNSDEEITKVQNQIIGEIQALRSFLI